jgi:hypothetical protein
MCGERAKGKIIVFGIMFFYPLAGVTFQFLHYLLGLRRLGYDVYYVEDSQRRVYDPTVGDLTEDARRNVEVIGTILNRFGFRDRWAYRSHYEARECFGLGAAQLAQLYREADAFLNVTGAQEIREEHMACPRRIYVESDPFASQVRISQGDQDRIDLIAAHDTHFSFGENLGASDCDTPIERFRWMPTRQPVAMDLWEGNGSADDAAFTTVTTWSNANNDVEYRGQRYYWTKDREFERLIDLPQRRATPFELAVKAGPTVCARLREYGWRVADAAAVSQTVDGYRAYVMGSRGEFTVARDQYVRPRTGWFSDRSACYLASGRPVITQDTGFGKYLPTGEGLFAFKDMDDVLAAVDAIESDYEGQCRAARQIAMEYFEAEKVLGSLMQRAGLA